MLGLQHAKDCILPVLSYLHNAGAGHLAMLPRKEAARPAQPATFTMDQSITTAFRPGQGQEAKHSLL